MIVVNALLGAGRTDEARDYLTAINTTVDSALRRISTGNFVADAIINNKAVTAAQTGGEITFDGSVPAEGIRSEDLCTVLSNLLDNAIEAIYKNDADRRTISISAGCSGECFFMKVSNPTMMTGENNLQTTKKDRRYHGIGLKNVRRCVERCDGTLIVTIENGMFTAEISMNLHI